NNSIFQNQHLYVLNPNEKINIGDWVYGFAFGVPFVEKVTKETIKYAHKYSTKIIATTDTDLNNKFKISKLSDDFLKKYCELGGIDEIMVKYKYKSNSGLD